MKCPLRPRFLCDLLVYFVLAMTLSFGGAVLVGQEPMTTGLVSVPLSDLSTGEDADSSWFAGLDEDETSPLEAQNFLETTSPFRLATMLQPTPLLAPRIAVNAPVESTIPPSSPSLDERLFQLSGLDRSSLRRSSAGVNSLASDLVEGSAASSRVTTDVGDLLRKTPTALSVGVQRRTPIVNDPRIRSNRVGSLAASGSYWVPARADLDTALSKIDSRMVENVLIIPGPYSSLYGPAFQVVDFQLLRSPRSDNGLQWNGRTSSDYNSNGNQIMGQQSISGGGEDWGLRASYVYRTGDSYRTGSGNTIASGYESSEFTLAIGRDLGDGRSLEFSLLRLDQFDVEFPSYVFDIDRLVTNAYEVTYTDENATIGDRAETEIWYNRTEFTGNAQAPAKRQQFPLLDRVDYVGNTDVDSMSTGYRSSHSWIGSGYDFTLGHDLRFIRQQLDETANATTLGIPIPVTDRNSPIPKSFSVNPGLFGEYSEELFEEYRFRTGARVDFVQTDVTANDSELSNLGLDSFSATYSEIVGTDQRQTDRVLWSLYAALDRTYSDELTGTVSLGFGQRAPTLTSLYAAQPFMLLLQNGFNNVTGDPTLKQEKMIQSDISLDYSGKKLKAGFRAFYGWGLDYITFENTNVVVGPPNGDVQQISLRYVNTDLATFVGGEAFAELFPQDRLTPFVTLRGTDGRDQTRDGNFATTNGSDGNPSQKITGLSRGFFSGLIGASAEPLPGISPFEMRLGVKLRDEAVDAHWNIEVSARVVDNQDRVATSLLEVPTPGFTTWDLRTVFQPESIDGLTLVCGIENIFDKAYREHLNNVVFVNGQPLQQPGINFYLGGDWVY
ncbi:TonB-dependent receptor [Aporhodopirellula aestuarii]|uniref:TonB-dependent receptor n=1 Tax=Aporhodopirellula aestuarii TaxID=2950107 RepID=A0ABT0U9X3_9BACT|nr:TonB-dependent receptor [Aporhodopirellula aestuarii]MCM2373698.1 TonB-dependent receptor [Aporhodopirellula aestuarii]